MKDKVGKQLLKWRIRTVKPFINGRLLDIGCGTNELVKNYGNGIGVDVYDWGNVDLIVEDTSKLPFRNKEFDTITIIASLNHIPNREDVLNESYRLLKDDGELIITMITPVISKIWHKIREPWDADQNQRGMQEDEVYGFWAKDILKLANNAKFVLVRKKKFMLRLNTVFVFTKIS